MKAPSSTSKDPETASSIDAWFSGPAAGSRYQRRKLAAAIARDPSAAPLLVEQARMEADLLARSRREASLSMLREIMSPAVREPVFYRKVWQRAAVLGAILLCGGIYITWSGNEMHGSLTPAVGTRSGLIAVNQQNQEHDAMGPDSDSRKPLLDGHAVQELMLRYQLPDGAGFRGEKINLIQAVAMVEEAIRRANVLKNPSLKPLRIQIQNPDGLSLDRSVSFRAGSVSAANLLKALAVMANAELSFGPDRVLLTLKPVPGTTEESRKLTTRVFRVPPDFAIRVMPPPPTEARKAEAADPFSTDDPKKTEHGPGGFAIKVTPAPPPGDEDAEMAGDTSLPVEISQRALPDNATLLKEFVRLHDLQHVSRLIYSAATSRLVMTAAQSELDRAEAAIEFLFAENPTQIALTAKLVELPDHWEMKDQILDDAGFQQLMRSWSQTAGVDVMTAPSIIARNGQRSLVEIVRDAPQPDGSMDWTGVKLSQKAVLTGEGIALDSLLNIGEKLTDGIDHREVEVSAVLRNHQTAMFLLSSPKPGRQVVGSVTVTLVDALGNTIGPKAGLTEESPPPETAPGDVR